MNEGVHCEGLRALEVDNVGLQMVCKFVRPLWAPAEVETTTRGYDSIIMMFKLTSTVLCCPGKPPLPQNFMAVGRVDPHFSSR